MKDLIKTVAVRAIFGKSGREVLEEPINFFLFDAAKLLCAEIAIKIERDIPLRGTRALLNMFTSHKRDSPSLYSRGRMLKQMFAITLFRAYALSNFVSI